jgi:hypothetical protein
VFAVNYPEWLEDVTINIRARYAANTKVLV